MKVLQDTVYIPSKKITAKGICRGACRGRKKLTAIDKAMKVELDWKLGYPLAFVLLRLLLAVYIRR